MKLDIYDDKYIIFLNKDNIKGVNFKEKREVEDCFRNLCTKIRKRINKDINGFFNIKVYLNNNFGAILIIEKEELEYYDYFSNQIDMQIEIDYDSEVLLKLNDFFDIELNFCDVYLYKNEFYIKYVDDIKYLEFTHIIYGEEVN